MSKITIDQLVDIVQSDLTVMGMIPKIIPDLEIERVVKEKALEYFYKNYQFALQKGYYHLSRKCITSDEYTREGYITLPDEIEGISRIAFISDPSLFQIGIQAPNLSINFGVSSQPFLSSFVTNIGELGVYRQIISAFSDELNKMAKNYVRHSFSHVSHRLNLLDQVRTDMMLEVSVRVQQEDLFDLQLFKDYVIGLSRMRMGQLLTMYTFNMPNGFQYNASEILNQGKEAVDKIEETIKGQSNAAWFIMAK